MNGTKIIIPVFICSIIFFILGYAYYEIIVCPSLKEEFHKKGYRQALLDVQLNITRKAEAFVKARWFDNFIIHHKLEDFTRSAFECYGTNWKKHIGMVWDLSFREATLYFIDKNNTLHVFYLNK